MSEIDKLREELAAQKAEQAAAREAARSAHDRIKEPLREFIDESREFKVEAWARLLREQGVDPNGHHICVWEATRSWGRVEWTEHYREGERYWDRPLTEGEAKFVAKEEAKMKQKAWGFCGCLVICAVLLLCAAIAKS